MSYVWFIIGFVSGQAACVAAFYIGAMIRGEDDCELH